MTNCLMFYMPDSEWVLLITWSYGDISHVCSEILLDGGLQYDNHLLAWAFQSNVLTNWWAVYHIQQGLW